MSENKIIEYDKHNELVVAKSGNSAWHTYKYKKQDLPLLIEDIERQYGIQAQLNHLNVIEDIKEGTIQPYLTKAGLNAIANANEISTKIEVLHRKMDKPFYAEVKATAVLKNGVGHDFIGTAMSTERNSQWLTYNQILAKAQTRARNGAITSAMEIQNCSWEEMEGSEEMERRKKTIKQVDNEILTKCPKCEQKGWSKLQKKCVQCGITYEDIMERAAQ